MLLTAASPWRDDPAACYRSPPEDWARQLPNGCRVPVPLMPLPVGGSGPPFNTVVPWAHASILSKLQLDRFSRFYRAHMVVPNRETDTQTTPYIGRTSPHLAVRAAVRADSTWSTCRYTGEVVGYGHGTRARDGRVGRSVWPAVISVKHSLAVHVASCSVYTHSAMHTGYTHTSTQYITQWRPLIKQVLQAVVQRWSLWEWKRGTCSLIGSTYIQQIHYCLQWSKNTSYNNVNIVINSSDITDIVLI